MISLFLIEQPSSSKCSRFVWWALSILLHLNYISVVYKQGYPRVWYMRSWLHAEFQHQHTIIPLCHRVCGSGCGTLSTTNCDPEAPKYCQGIFGGSCSLGLSWLNISGSGSVRPWAVLGNYFPFTLSKKGGGGEVYSRVQTYKDLVSYNFYFYKEKLNKLKINDFS